MWLLIYRNKDILLLTNFILAIENNNYSLCEESIYANILLNLKNAKVKLMLLEKKEDFLRMKKNLNIDKFPVLIKINQSIKVINEIYHKDDFIIDEFTKSLI